MKKTAFSVLVLACLLAPLGAQANAVAGVSKAFINIKEAGAKGDGVTDDTAVFQEVLGAGKGNPHEEYGMAREIYIPNGTYLLSDEIEWGDKKKQVIGESRAGVVLKLTDNAPGYDDPENPKCFLNNQFGHAGQNFSQYIRNMTIDIGTGNPGAIGVRLHTNNGGGMMNCTLRSSDPDYAGHTGIWMPQWPGPGLTQDVLIEGFDTGIAIGSDQYSWTFVDVTLRHQRKTAFLNAGNTVSLFRVTSDNQVPAVINQGASAFMVMANCAFNGNQPSQPAILNQQDATLLVRQTTVEGYAQAIENRTGTQSGAEAGFIEQFSSHQINNRFDTPAQPIGLQWQDPPQIPDPDPSQHTIAYVSDFNPPMGNYHNQDGSPDCSGAIQRAIDSGADYVIMPEEGFFVSKQSIRVRGNVRKLMSLGARLNFRVPTGPAWIVEEGTPEVVELSIHGTYGNQSLGIEHASKRTVICRGDYYNTVPGGKVFMQNFVGAPIVMDRQMAWMGSVNTETYEIYPHIANYGGDMLVVGHKTEKDRPAIGTYAGGRTEVLGGLLYKNRNPLPECPAMIIRDAYAFYAYRNKGYPYTKWVLEERDGVERIQTRQGMYASAPDGLAVPTPMNTTPGEAIEILGVMYAAHDAQSEIELVLHYRGGGEGPFTSIDLTQDEYDRWHGAIPGSVSDQPVHYYVEAFENGALRDVWPANGADEPATVLPDETPPALPSDPWIVEHDKWGYLLAWEPAQDRETRPLFYQIYVGSSQEEAAGNLWRKVLCNQYHQPFQQNDFEPGTWLGVQPVDYAGHEGEIRFVQYDPEQALAFDREQSPVW